MTRFEGRQHPPSDGHGCVTRGRGLTSGDESAQAQVLERLRVTSNTDPGASSPGSGLTPHLSLALAAGKLPALCLGVSQLKIAGGNACPATVLQE